MRSKLGHGVIDTDKLNVLSDDATGFLGRHHRTDGLAVARAHDSVHRVAGRYQRTHHGATGLTIDDMLPFQRQFRAERKLAIGERSFETGQTSAKAPVSRERSIQ